MPSRECPECHAFMLVYDSHVVGQYRYRYLRCPECGYKPGSKEVIPLAYAPSRRSLPPRRVLKRRPLRRRR